MSYAEARLGRERAQDGAYIWQGFLKAGVKYLPLGSDFPVEHMNPFLGIYAAVTRKTVNGTSVSVFDFQLFVGFDEAANTLTILIYSHMDRMDGSLSKNLRECRH